MRAGISCLGLITIRIGSVKSNEVLLSEGPSAIRADFMVFSPNEEKGILPPSFPPIFEGIAIRWPLEV